MRLAWKINGALIVVITGVLTLQARTRVVREQEFLDAEMSRDHYVLGRAVKPAIEDDWRQGGRSAAVGLAARLGAGDDDLRVRVVSLGSDDAPDLPESATRALDRGASVSVARDAPAPGWRYTYVPLDPELTGRALIELRETQAPVEAFTDQTTLRVASWLALLVLVTSSAVGLMMQLMVVRPVQRLSEHAQRIAAGELHARVGKGSRDELGSLAHELDRMAEALATSAEQLEREQRQRERAMEQLRHADRLMSVGQLAAGVAHELGTPLNVALIRARMIERGEAGTGEEARSFATTIAQQCERMAQIIRQLLDFARPRAPSLAPTQVQSAVRQVVLLLGPTARRAGVTLESRFEADPVLPLDPQQFEQVLLNLVTNAVHATGSGGKVEVVVGRSTASAPPTVNGAQDWIAVSVTDTGTGIEPEHLGRVFEPFFTTKDVGKGTGLGLSVSHGIIREHGGWIDVDSTPGQGARFTIYLPWPNQRTSLDKVPLA